MLRVRRGGRRGSMAFGNMAFGSMAFGNMAFGNMAFGSMAFGSPEMTLVRFIRIEDFVEFGGGDATFFKDFHF